MHTPDSHYELFLCGRVQMRSIRMWSCVCAHCVWPRCHQGEKLLGTIIAFCLTSLCTYNHMQNRCQNTSVAVRRKRGNLILLHQAWWIYVLINLSVYLFIYVPTYLSVYVFISLLYSMYVYIGNCIRISLCLYQFLSCSTWAQYVLIFT